MGKEAQEMLEKNRKKSFWEKAKDDAKKKEEERKLYLASLPPEEREKEEKKDKREKLVATIWIVALITIFFIFASHSYLALAILIFAIWGYPKNDESSPAPFQKLKELKNYKFRIALSALVFLIALGNANTTQPLPLSTQSPFVQSVASQKIETPEEKKARIDAVEKTKKEKIEAEEKAKAEKVSEITKLIGKNTDDFKKYQKEFLEISVKMFDEGKCTKDDLSVGWMKAQFDLKKEPFYFMFCTNEQWYFNTKTKEFYSKTARDKARKEEIGKQFSAWDGSNYTLEKYIKSSMNDPDSYEHVETRYVDNGNDITVYTKFRGTNAFGGKVVNVVGARMSLSGEILEILK